MGLYGVVVVIKREDSGDSEMRVELWGNTDRSHSAAVGEDAMVAQYGPGAHDRIAAGDLS